MAEHNLFYYPYASFTDEQLPLLKVAALWFDKLVILDPVDAGWNTIGASQTTRDAIGCLEQEGILEVVTPSSVLARYEAPLADAIRRDMRDPEFLDLCEAHSRDSGWGHWTLSLKKVPQDVQADRNMRYFMGDFAHELALEAARDRASKPGGNAADYQGYAEVGQAYDELRDGCEYRYADFPLALGESIMMNHALFSGLLHADATPITDDPFHSQTLALKLRHVARDPSIHKVIADRIRKRRLKTDQLAATALTDKQLRLPMLNPALSLEDVLNHRKKHSDALQQARDKLGWMARRIEAEPWSEEFAMELEHRTIPDIARELEEARKAQDAWLKSKSGRLAMKAAGVAIGGVSAVLSLFTAPVTPIGLTVAGLGLASGAVIPAFDWLYDWQDGKKSLHENGLHYLLKYEDTGS